MNKKSSYKKKRFRRYLSSFYKELGEYKYYLKNKKGSFYTRLKQKFCVHEWEYKSDHIPLKRKICKKCYSHKILY